jgi:hypothetical protein
MSRILFHLNSISERGTTTAALEYAQALKKKGHTAVFGFDQRDKTNHPLFIKKIAEEWPLIPYVDFQEFSRKEAQLFDFAYFIKSGENDGKFIPGVTNYIHCVFQSYEPHGDIYAYVSEWLANQMRLTQASSDDKEFLSVPHIVDMPDPTIDLRQKLGIPKSAICGIRIGGIETFDIKFVRDLVMKLAHQDEYYFIFINTEVFTNSPNVKFLNTVFDKQMKANLLASADYFLHARERGESFGVAIVEAIQMGIPVFAWEGGIDRNHVQLLPTEMLYKDENDLRLLIQCSKSLKSEVLRLTAEEFRPDSVIKKFLKVFPV